MNSYTPLSRAQTIAVTCPTCAAEPGEACRRDGAAQGSSHAERLARARAGLTRHRTGLRDAEGQRKLRVSREFLKP